jgi:hypothetical protein
VGEGGMDISLPSGLNVRDAESKLLRFSNREYAYYDGIPSTEPNRITPMDVMVTNAMNSNVNSAGKIRIVHLGLDCAWRPILYKIPEEANLLDDSLEEELIKQLFTASCSVKHVLLPVATKVLHRKRRNLIPILDYVVLKHYVGKSGVAKAQNKLNVPGIADVGIEALKKFRYDLRATQDSIQTACEFLAKKAYHLSHVRVLEALIWIESEPRGYYRLVSGGSAR